MGGLKCFLYHQIGNCNPAGIDINLGWYALAECIIVGTYPSIALLRWCDLKHTDKPRKKIECKRRYAPPSQEVNEKIIQIYKENPQLKNREIAKMVGRSDTLVSKVLHGIGVIRNRWDGYISKDKRYSKNKKGEIK